MKAGAALTNQNVSGHDLLTAKFFDAQTLAYAIASVLSAAFTFFMCHGKRPFLK
jgi:hypothetical protein